MQIYDEGQPCFEPDLWLSASEVREECRRGGLVVRSARELAGRTGSRIGILGLQAVRARWS